MDLIKPDIPLSLGSDLFLELKKGPDGCQMTSLPSCDHFLSNFLSVFKLRTFKVKVIDSTFNSFVDNLALLNFSGMKRSNNERKQFDY